MGCRRPAMVRHIYAGADALAVDEAVLADLGVADPRLAPIVAQAYHWFGLEPAPVTVDGDRPPLGRQLRGAHGSVVLRGLGTASYPSTCTSATAENFSCLPWTPRHFRRSHVPGPPPAPCAG